MRDVAARADVAMGTVYRYFTSKDHLLAATLVHWVEMLDTRIGQHPPRGATPRRPRARRPRPGPARHGPPAQARRRRLHLAVLARPGRRRLPAADHAADGGHHPAGHGRARHPRHVGPGPHDRPRLVLGAGRVDQRLVHDDAGLRRAGGVGATAAARRARRAARRPPDGGRPVRDPDRRDARARVAADDRRRPHPRPAHRVHVASPSTSGRCSPSTTCPSPSSPGGSPGSSGPTDRARRRRCACCSAWSTPRLGRPPSGAATTATWRTPRARSARCSRRPASTPPARPAPTCAWRPGPAATTTSGPTRCSSWSA